MFEIKATAFNELGLKRQQWKWTNFKL
jgi:hypothetical protein